MPICNLTIQLVVVDLYSKYEVSILNGCGDIFDEKFGRKKKGQTQGRTNRRMPICNPTIQLVVVDLYIKYEVSILNGCGDIFDKKVLRNYGRTDGRTDGTTDRCKPVYPPTFSKRGYKYCYCGTCLQAWKTNYNLSQISRAKIRFVELFLIIHRSKQDYMYLHILFYFFFFFVKVVIITNLGQRQKSA